MTKNRILRQMNLILPVLLFGLAFSPFPSNKVLSEGLQSRQAPSPIRIVDSNEQSIIVELTAGRPHVEAVPQQQDKIPHHQADTGGGIRNPKSEIRNLNTAQHSTAQHSTAQHTTPFLLIR